MCQDPIDTNECPYPSADTSSQKDGTGQADAASKDTSAPDGSPADGGSGDTSTADAPTDTSSNDASSDAGCKAGDIELTVKNYKKWCSVSINGGTASDDETQTVCVAPGTTVDLKAGAESKKFELGKDPWHDTTSEDGGEATIKVSKKDDCVWVCCPFADGGAGCPTMNQCK
jgi:hypothetical protein